MDKNIFSLDDYEDSDSVPINSGGSSGFGTEDFGLGGFRKRPLQLYDNFSASSDQQSGRPAKKKKTPWWQEGVVYHVYVRSFCDTNKDGIGDLRGVAEKAGYLHDLGVGTVWLSPFFQSPMADFGYDISNFTAVDPIFGTMDDFKALVKAMHDKHIKVVLDFVPNHTSDEHEWFQKSKRREGNYSNYYVWQDPIGWEGDTPIPPNNWLSVFRGSAWKWCEERQQFYYHAFLDQQPDLNYRERAVREEMKKVLKFWLEKGVDGFRVDAVMHLFEDEHLRNETKSGIPGLMKNMDYNYLNHYFTINQPEIFEVLSEWRNILDSYGDKLMMVEVFDDDVNQIMRYYGNESVPLADFPFNFRLIQNFQCRQDLSGFSLRDTLDEWLNNMPKGKWPNWVIGNHDNGRISSRLGVDLIDSLNMILMLLPGTPITYYGEEIGMKNGNISWEDTQDPVGCSAGQAHFKEYSRDPERTPMQWDDSENAGFTKDNHTWLPVNSDYSTLNVKKQNDQNESHLKVYKSLVTLRKDDLFRKGSLAFPVITQDIFSFMRYSEEAQMMVLVNTGTETVEVNLHDHTNIFLPDEASIVIKSTNSGSNYTDDGSKISLTEVKLVSGEGIVLNLYEESEQESY